MRFLFRVLHVLAVLAMPLFSAEFAAAQKPTDGVLVEAESFNQQGGWKLDTQFINIMGSPYLLAHGLGQPVEDAKTTVQFPSTGKYRVFVRTKDWVAPWKASGTPGRFQLAINGKPLSETFGTKSATWFWHDGGTIEINKPEAELTLHDLTGFEGRCDAILFTKDLAYNPPNEAAPMNQWRKSMLGLPDLPQKTKPYDLVVVGGGYAGMGAAISAARMGCKVALIQNRPVLGGNGSSEVRVWAQGLVRRGKYPHIGEIIAEFADSAAASPGTYEEYGDQIKEKIVKAEKNIDLFLNTHAYAVKKEGTNIQSVTAFNTKTSERTEFLGTLFSDCTGHGEIGFLAGADYYTQEKGHMGMSNMWTWKEAEKSQSFPNVEWALNLNMEDFPYPQKFHGQWFWESGFDKDPIKDLESMRDWNFRAVYGAWNAMKNKDGKEKHPNAILTWMAYIGGPRESRMLRGDVILRKKDIIAKVAFPDGCVPSTWSIDLHYPKKQFMKKYPEDPFISQAVFDSRVDRKHGYPVPYRCFYSRNVSNLFMAGRCVSVTHEALGTVRVMKTGGMMGEVVGKAAAVCTKRKCTPRQVYKKYYQDLDQLMSRKGIERRDSIDGSFYIPKNAKPLPPVIGAYIDPATLPGLVIDDEHNDVQFIGKWTKGEGLKGFIGNHYVYHGKGPKAEIHFKFQVKQSGKYEVRLAYGHHKNRASNTPVTIRSSQETKTVKINQQIKPPLKNGFISLGTFQFEKNQPIKVIMSNSGVDGNVHADAIQVLPIE
ncbi:MAG: FAD-dependent oxidoreductase [Planctomycetes bacterium]|nr:FAD-dependent oxidoreductase [Planctomycetota bacterium]MCH9724114.1 FAD-dependent oxidoreductase [Planctomycetota bacterium]MCH9778170.1 FAD-dependent oxidoreductase [Planctomycetota bacterium]MCH9789346.1 FAD-dependent oxidoreductase [Planctomycetota bacterium]